MELCLSSCKTILYKSFTIVKINLGIYYMSMKFTEALQFIKDFEILGFSVVLNKDHGIVLVRKNNK